MQYLTLDVISEVALGQAFGDLKADADVNDYLKSSEEGLRSMSAVTPLGFPFNYSLLTCLQLVMSALAWEFRGLEMCQSLGKPSVPPRRTNVASGR